MHARAHARTHTRYKYEEIALMTFLMTSTYCVAQEFPKVNSLTS